MNQQRKQTSNKRLYQKKLVWSKPADLVLLTELLAYHCGCTRRMTLFPAEVWITATEKVNKVFPSRVISIKQVKTRCYWALDSMGQSPSLPPCSVGLGRLGIAIDWTDWPFANTASKFVDFHFHFSSYNAGDWERASKRLCHRSYLQKEPKAKQFRWRAIDYFDELSELYGDGPNFTLGNAAGRSVIRSMASTVLTAWPRSHLNLSASTPGSMSTSPDSDYPPPRLFLSLQYYTMLVDEPKMQ
ncbi:hypothetical protein L873DRAFT_1841582 [Choiromyces venosus 120613-1]|uniref:Uncharacterized protein n=1 Tax=Choiromyces venosus 120613-1 TaxID=1336337 RepID=A0A3N4K0E6_9PEZI|nr:hypothetical protein L873DRAFT_1841582 [Choiromyces venosus 120613-1]